MGMLFQVVDVLLIALILLSSLVDAESPYRVFNWRVSYGDICPMGVRQQGILINGQFPGPEIHAVTNDNIYVNVFNDLPEFFLISWNGLQQRKNSYQDGVYGTTCPIPPGYNFTYKMQAKDQIGNFFYFPSTAFHKAAGAFGAIRISPRPLIPVPYPTPAADYSILIGDWYTTDHWRLRDILDQGKMLNQPDGILINGRSGLDPRNTAYFTVETGKTYRFRISNIGLRHTLNFRIQGHKLTLVEVEGTHTMQTTYDSLDIHLGQSYSVLITANQPLQDYYIAVSSRFTNEVLSTAAVLHYQGSRTPVSGPLPVGPTTEVGLSLNQARSIRTNLTASGPRPNPQGSYHYGQIQVSRTIKLQTYAGQINGKQRYAVNKVSFVPKDTPLKIADYYNIPGIYQLGSITDWPPPGQLRLDTSVMSVDYRAFAEIILQNHENIPQSWHLDGYNFFVVGMDGGDWTPEKRNHYNLHDAISRCTTQVYPRSWTAILVMFDNMGMWNMRSENWARQYLGQQFYLRVYAPTHSLRDEYLLPDNAFRCGRAAHL